MTTRQKGRETDETQQWWTGHARLFGRCAFSALYNLQRTGCTGGRRNETVWQLYAKLTNSVKYKFISPRNSSVIIAICFGSDNIYDVTVRCDDANQLIYLLRLIRRISIERSAFVMTYGLVPNSVQF